MEQLSSKLSHRARGRGVLSMMGDSVFNVLSVLSQHESAGLLLSE